MFGGWDYSAILSMVDSLVYDRRYGGFYEIINNLTVRELLEVFTVIQNKINEENLNRAVADNASNSSQIPTEELSQDMLDFLMGT